MLYGGLEVKVKVKVEVNFLSKIRLLIAAVLSIALAVMFFINDRNVFGYAMCIVAVAVTIEFIRLAKNKNASE
jgi:hypothetical protein